MTSGEKAGYFRRVSANAVGFPCGPTVLDPKVAADGPAQFLQPLRERRDADWCFRIVRGNVHEHADAPDPVALLRARRDRPPGCRAAEQRDELPPSHVEHRGLPPQGSEQSIARRRAGPWKRPELF
jgi:hypothetical protein